MPRQQQLDWLVAHRGWPAEYPENSLEGVRAVLDAGARFVEFDVQLTADHYPVVFHDDDLDRLAGLSGRITRLKLDQLEEIRVGPEHRRTSSIPTLAAMLALVGEYPGVTAFVELKRHSIRRFGLEVAVDAVMRQIHQAHCACVFLSFNAGAAALARRRGAPDIGWVFRPWSVVARWRAWRLQPDYLFVRSDRVPKRPRPFWPGKWKWVIYQVDDLATARQFIERGADLIEVNDLPALLEHDH